MELMPAADQPDRAIAEQNFDIPSSPRRLGDFLTQYSSTVSFTPDIIPGNILRATDSGRITQVTSALDFASWHASGPTRAT